MTRHLSSTVVEHTIIQSPCKSPYKVNLHHVVNSVARPRELPLRGEGRTVHIQGVPVRGFFAWAAVEALRQVPVEGGVITELLDQSHVRCRLTVREL